LANSGLDDLVQHHGFRLSRKIYNDALREAGESE
jgi:predicted nucleic acid-binding protein